MNEEENVVMNDFSSSVGLEKPSFFEKNKKLIIAGISILLALIFIIIIIIIILLSSKNNKKRSSCLGHIKCTYEVENLKTKILGNDFSKEFDLDISIDGEIVKYSRDYTFNNTGLHNVDFLIYDKNINLDYMFKDISELISVEMTINDNKEIKIKSMISTFENCENLDTFTMEGFNINEMKSMSKLFYNTQISTINMPFSNFENIEDISYMFASTNVINLDLSNLKTTNVKNMSHLFYNSYSLRNLNIDNFNTSNVIDMSHMFDSCESLSELNLNHFNTKNVINMSSMFKN